MKNLLDAKAVTQYYNTFLPHEYYLTIEPSIIKVFDEDDKIVMSVSIDGEFCMATTEMKANDFYKLFGYFLDELCSDFNGNLVIYSKDYQGWY